ncbi:hypothetical protein G7B40_025085 [Aetokthonos hydrillicola Thurmond2011]|jgi:hypothetical protein|uniref:Uncharacterized protein n=1 Tax=Aetokthonos hydrillicola Thurmond2011 TaxID=2712845 RepID=A0AAP5MBD6_9CYAN|nr:hypothetical protein [Aetokthonos hydrillicola]MBO3458469.1 hypothetical protein [Aetokthonos hydrillicola CCALA 1050]MBW4586204.1 hypothetical protein [Aetokthonos hydrillicola CCALA 1050]MDR9897812.1 hypothetical protein [Aetokthonos hydrillicola Thurmond2011]
MSLTSELRNQNSPLRKWFNGKLNNAIIKLVSNHNNLMCRQPIIRPLEGTDFALVGNAVCYAVRKYLSQTANDANWIYKTIANVGAKKLNVVPLLEKCAMYTNVPEEEAFLCLLLAVLEGTGRMGISNHPMLQPFIKGEKLFHLDKEFFEKWQPSITDAAAIIKTIPNTWQSCANGINGRIISNATFSLSNCIGGADAQIICSNVLIDVRTSAKSQPFTLENLYQQISYCLLDTDDMYSIRQLVWYYSRQQALFIYPIEKLFRNLPSLRKEFADMILENYGNDNELFENFLDSKYKIQKLRNNFELFN